MCAWYIVRVKTKGTKLMYTLCLFSNEILFTNPVNINTASPAPKTRYTMMIPSGFVKSISLEIEEAAMIDGCTPLQMYFRVVFPILRPTAVTVAILEAMWGLK